MHSFKSGFISILGKPNVGKSTLLNRILGDKITIVSEKPQTTRTRIIGIKNLENAQLIFYDTPGIHRPRSRLQDAMVRRAFQAGNDADLILLLTEAHQPDMKTDESILKDLSSPQIPVFLIINKIDLVKKTTILPLIESYHALYAFSEIIPISARHGEGVEELITVILKRLSPGPQYFHADMTTDQSERFLAAEMVREQVFQHTYQEIPYAVGVAIETFRDDPDTGLLSVSAVIFVERQSQKAILIGRKGHMLKRIGTHARQEMERFFATRVFLRLWVKVKKDWPDDPRLLDEMGYG
jgi:GTP-binding protein Era